MNDERININVVIADRPYPVKVKKEEESIVRQAAKEINNTIKDFQKQYSSRDKQDYLAMMALQNRVESKMNSSDIDLQEFKERIDEKIYYINHIVSSHLNIE